MAAFCDTLQPVLPDDSAEAALAGRVWRPDAGGPSVVAVRGPDLIDISASFATMRDLCEADAPAERLRSAPGEHIGALGDTLDNTPPETRNRGKPWLLTPIDLQAIKAAGVTFVISRAARRCCSARRRTTPRPVPSARSCASSMQASHWTTSGRPPCR